MPNEKRLIDLNDLTLEYGGLSQISPHDFAGICKYFVEQLEIQPVIDAVEVVRCKDCIHAVEIEKDYIRNLFIDGTKQCEEGRGDMCYGVSIVSDGGFCSSGERRCE